MSFEASSHWINYNKNRKFEFFDENKEKNWNGPFYFIQGADIQFGFIARELESKKVVTWEKEKHLAAELVKRINAMNPRPRFFVMCGDLIDELPDGDQDIRQQQIIDYKKIFGMVNKEIPVVCVCGNHDVGNTPTPETLKRYHSSFGDDFFSFWCGGVLFLAINSQFFVDSSKVQEIASRHSNWIDTQLEEAQKEKKRVVIFQHVPWFLNSVDDEDCYFTINKEIRKKWMEKFHKSGVKSIFCGHYHRNAGGLNNDLDVVITTAVGGQLGNDKPGARVVNVLNNKIEHTFYYIESLPLNHKF